jgi:hypothetical protein
VKIDRKLRWNGWSPSRRGVSLAAVVLLPLAFVAPATPASVDLTKGASTIVPASMNPGVKDAFGQPYEVRTRVTAVRFHVGTIPSTAPGGLSSTPQPQLKELHGVRYYQVTGELSGIGHTPIGVEYVYGPIDAKGVDQSQNPASPRFGLRGIPFRLIYPTTWNGHLIVYRNGGDGGRGSGHYLYQSIMDEVALVSRGYAYFVTLGGGTTPFDSNPDSSSGAFWKLAPPFWAPSGPEEPDFVRAVSIGSNWSESLIPDSQPGLAWFPGEPSPVSTPIGRSTFMSENQISIQDDVPTFRDHINVAKNLLQLLTGSRPSETGVVSWSRSGDLAAGMDFGRTAQQPPSDIASPGGVSDLFRVLTPRTGGDYKTPYDPKSGRVADWFVVRSGVEQATAPQPPDGQPDFFDMLPDPEYPIAAPLVYISAEVDLSYIQLNGYLFANELADALPGSKIANKDVNAWLRLYTLHGATHQPREAWFAGPSDGGNRTWYDYATNTFNGTGQGLELPAWMDAVRANNPDLLADLNTIPLFDSNLLSEEGFELQTILNADRWGGGGAPPPTSRVDANLVVNPTTSTRSPSYPVAKTCTPDDIFGKLRLDCLHTLNEDSVINDPSTGFGPLGDPFPVSLLQTFASGPLRYSTEPIDLPGEAAPLGYHLFTPGPALLSPFTNGQLRVRYGTHDGYVAAVSAAVSRVVSVGLYDPAIGALDVAAAQNSSVLR